MRVSGNERVTMRTNASPGWALFIMKRAFLTQNSLFIKTGPDFEEKKKTAKITAGTNSELGSKTLFKKTSDPTFK